MENDWNVENENQRGLKIVETKLGQEKAAGQCSSAPESRARAGSGLKDAEQMFAVLLEERNVREAKAAL